MKRTIVLAFGLVAWTCVAEVLLADPSLVPIGNRYFLIGTENGLGATRDVKASGKSVFPLYVSDDLDHWRLADTPNGEGRLLATDQAVGKAHFWAPQVFPHDGRYFLCYTCEYHLGLAVSDRFEGPYRAYAEFPRHWPGNDLDPFLFRDADGGIYLYSVCGNLGGLVGVRLSDDLKSLVGEPVRCVANDQAWEHLPLEEHYKALNRRFGYTGGMVYSDSTGVVEGPTVIRRHGKYVLFYSANSYTSPDYCVGVAVADKPLGPWRKLQAGPVLSRAETGLNGTGHGDVFTGPDGALWYVFHAHHSAIRIHPRRAGVIRLKETVGADGYPRYEADIPSMRLL